MNCKKKHYESQKKHKNHEKNGRKKYMNYRKKYGLWITEKKVTEKTYKWLISHKIATLILWPTSLLWCDTQVAKP